MFLVVAKTLEVAARAFFVLGISYALDLGDAGRFGIIVTLVSLFVFAATFERHLDFQRRYIDLEPGNFDREVAHLLRFWAINQLVALPLLVGATFLMLGVSVWMSGLVIVIALAEHVASGTYQLALVTPRYRVLLVFVILRNLAAAAGVVALYVWHRDGFGMAAILEIWAGCQVVGAMAVLAGWNRVRVHPTAADSALPRRAVTQYRQSATHFKIGLIAVLIQRTDQLIVGALLPLAQTGIYFRHMLLIAIAYQFFTIASWSRLMPVVFRAAKTQTNTALLKLIRREWFVVCTILIGCFLVGWASDVAIGGLITTRFHVSIALAAVVLGTAIVRITADLLGLLCHVRMREDMILREQLRAYGVTAVGVVAMTHFYGVFGTATATLIGAVVYLLLIIRAVSGLRGTTVQISTGASEVKL